MASETQIEASEIQMEEMPNLDAETQAVEVLEELLTRHVKLREDDVNLRKEIDEVIKVVLLMDGFIFGLSRVFAVLYAAHILNCHTFYIQMTVGSIQILAAILVSKSKVSAPLITGNRLLTRKASLLRDISEYLDLATEFPENALWQGLRNDGEALRDAERKKISSKASLKWCKWIVTCVSMVCTCVPIALLRLTYLKFCLKNPAP